MDSYVSKLINRLNIELNLQKEWSVWIYTKKFGV